MTQFFKKFLVEENVKLSAETGRFLAIGVFGKHPGWDDHIEGEGLGMETVGLNGAKELLYGTGVRGQIDAGAWEKLEPAQRLEGFNHLFLWRREGQFLLGRMWSSSDGKGRSRYPMVVCAHCIGAPWPWTVEHLLPRLARIENACKSTNSPADVKAILEQARTELRSSLINAPAQTPMSLMLPESLQRMSSNPVFGPDQQGWLRILYQLQSQMTSFCIGAFSPKTDTSALRAQHIRLPLGASSPEEAMLLWFRFLSFKLDKFVPKLLVLCTAENWVDVLVGEPSSQQFFCLRARPAALPLATDVPYEMDDKFKTQARALVTDFLSGKESSAQAEADAAAAPGAWATVTQFFRGKGAKLWIGVALCLVAAAALLVVAPWTRHPQADTGKDRAPPVASVPVAPPNESSLAPNSPQSLGSSGSSSVAAKAQADQQAELQKAAEAEAKRISDQQEREKKIRQAAAQEAARQAEEKKRQEEAETNRVAAEARVAAEKKRMEEERAAALAKAEPTPPPPVESPATAQPATTQPVQATSTKQDLTNSLGMVMIWVPDLPGAALGGWVGKFEVTQKEFETVMGNNPSVSKNPLQPAENVTWTEASAFCAKLTQREKSSGAAPAGLVYALPTVAQWEFFVADATFDKAVTSLSAPQLLNSPLLVGSKAPNRYGLYDVLGNVWEWCAEASPQRTLRGGAYNTISSFQFRKMETKTPRFLNEADRKPDAGFRCIAILAQ